MKSMTNTEIQYSPCYFGCDIGTTTTTITKRLNDSTGSLSTIYAKSGDNTSLLRNHAWCRNDSTLSFGDKLFGKDQSTVIKHNKRFICRSWFEIAEDIRKYKFKIVSHNGRCAYDIEYKESHTQTIHPKDVLRYELRHLYKDMFLANDIKPKYMCLTVPSYSNIPYKRLLCQTGTTLLS